MNTAQGIAKAGLAFLATSAPINFRESRRRRLLKKAGLPCNKPMRTPSHPTKSHVVKACENGVEKLIRFGEQGAITAGKPKKNESKRMKMKRKSFKARHRKNIAKGKLSAAWWASVTKW